MAKRFPNSMRMKIMHPQIQENEYRAQDDDENHIKEHHNQITLN
jgi:hypothetical protein